MGAEEIQLVRSTIQSKGLSWSAGSTHISELPKESQKKYLGLFVKEDAKKTIMDTMSKEDALLASRGIAFVYPSSWNWRNVSGRDWTTPVRDQSGCSACVAFAVVAAVESCLEIFRKNPLLNPDLSEADLFFQGCGNCCASGWNFSPALNYIKDNGIPDEQCYPYKPGQSLSACPDRANRIVKIGEWRFLSSASEAKEWISKKGPVITGMEVGGDFFYYRGGIYSYCCGDYVGDHAVCIVGYDDAGGYWICKNSWGPGWGESGWFRIYYGNSNIGTRFGYYGVDFSTTSDIVSTKKGRVIARFKSRDTSKENEFRLYSPDNKPIFIASTSNIGKAFEVGSYASGTRLVFALKTSDNQVYYTDPSLNTDSCNHVQKVQIEAHKWELRWEDSYSLSPDQDYNDLVLEIEIVDAANDDIVLTSSGRVLASLKSKRSAFSGQFRLYRPNDKLIFDAIKTNSGSVVDLGTYQTGAVLSFALTASDGRTYCTDSILNPDLCPHEKKLLTGINKWELCWEDSYNLVKKDYNAMVVSIELAPISNDDIVLGKNARVVARLVSRRANSNNEFRLHRPDGRSIFMASAQNLGKTFEVGTFPANTRLVFALASDNGNTYYTDSSLNTDAKSHIFKLPLGANKCQLRWEDAYNMKEKDYTDLVVEITVLPK